MNKIIKIILPVECLNKQINLPIVYAFSLFTMRLEIFTLLTFLRCVE